MWTSFVYKQILEIVEEAVQRKFSFCLYILQFENNSWFYKISELTELAYKFSFHQLMKKKLKRKSLNFAPLVKILANKLMFEIELNKLFCIFGHVKENSSTRKYKD